MVLEKHDVRYTTDIMAHTIEPNIMIFSGIRDTLRRVEESIVLGAQKLYT